MSNSTAPSTWDQNAFEALMNAEAKDRRASRKIFAPDAPQNKYITTGVDNYTTTAGTTLTLGQPLAPITIRASVSITVSAQDHMGLRGFGARQMGDAFSSVEDLVVLLGSAATIPPTIGDVALTVDSNELKQQQGVFSSKQGSVAKGKVIQSSITALNNLRSRGHHGPFIAIVAPDLNEEAWTPTHAGIIQAPIYAVLPELRSPEDGWIWSDAVPSRQGVVISLGGQTFDFVVAYDPHVESALVTNSFDIEAALQFRLRINQATAIEPLA